MHTSRLGKLIVILLGAIGLLYVGGGHAHADSVNVQSSSVGNVSVNNVSTSSTVITDTNQTTTSSASKEIAAVPSDKSTAVGADSDQTPKVVSSEVSTPDNSANPTSEISTKTDLPTIIAEGTTPPVAGVAGPTASNVIYYHTQRTVPTIVGTDHGTPQTSAQGNQPKPAVPTLPQGPSGLVSTAVAPTPVLKFHGGFGPTPLTPDLNLAFGLVLMITLASALIVSAFLSFLRASGFATAPRGSSPRFNFAFPVGEFGLSHRLETSSLFSTPQRLLGSWWDQGGRI